MTGRPRHILAMVHLWPPRHCAGAEMMAESMLRALVERGHRVDVLLSRPTGDGVYVRHGITVYPFESKHDPWPRVADCDIVVSHLENVPRATVLARLFGKKIVHLCHNTHPVTKTWVDAGADLVVFNSQWMADALACTSRSIVVRPPVYADEYATTPGTKVTLVNLNEAKGGEVLLKLATRMPDVPFLAVKGAYGEQIVPDLPNVTVLEHGTDMRAAYAQTRVLLMPSSYESWGRVGVEAMCSGIPVIAHPTPGLVESLGNAGIFVDRDNLDEWETHIRRLMRPNVWRKASTKATARAAQLDPAEDLARWCAAVEGL